MNIQQWLDLFAQGDSHPDAMAKVIHTKLLANGTVSEEISDLSAALSAVISMAKRPQFERKSVADMSLVWNGPIDTTQLIRCLELFPHNVEVRVLTDDKGETTPLQRADYYRQENVLQLY